MMGMIDILNTGAGHLKITVPSEAGPIEKANYERIISDMLRRGYLLFVQHEGKQIKVDSYDQATGEYILANYPEAHHVANQINQAAATETAPTETRRRGRQKGVPNKPRIPASTSNVTAIGRSAGG